MDALRGTQDQLDAVLSLLSAALPAFISLACAGMLCQFGDCFQNSKEILLRLKRG